MNLDSLIADKKLMDETDKYFGKVFYVVAYELDPFDFRSLNRLIVIDEVPGKFAQIFGSATTRRFFVGRAEWFEIINDVKVRCPEKLCKELILLSETLEKKNKKRLKAKKIKKGRG